MPNDRLLRILARLSAHDGTTPSTRLCVVSAEITEMSGAGIMLMTDDRPQGSLCTTDRVSARIEDLQYTLGEGPCVDAHRRDVPVIEPDLAEPTVVRWMAFGPAALAAGARAVFGFPIVAGVARLGALNLYRDRAGPLSPTQHDDAVILAEVAGRAIINMQAQAAPGELGPDLEVGGDFRFVVHQAAGMVAVQLGLSVDAALVRIRAYAFRHDRSVTAVAVDVIDRRLRFDQPDTDADPDDA